MAQAGKKKIKGDARRVVFTNGVFDILHRGHVTYLSKAKALGDYLVVGLNADASVRRLKGQDRPVNSQADRKAVLLALKAVDEVIIFREDTPEHLIRNLKPDVLVKGADYKLSEIVGADLVRSYGGVVKRIPLVAGRSTTTTIKRLQRTHRSRRS